jgi:ribosomal protein S18 acetylase RimI-like enzyme
MYTLRDYIISKASSSEEKQVINMLKQIAQWMKNHGINQWQFLLDGGDDEEIKEAVAKGNTYLLKKGNEIIGTFTLSDCQSEWDEHIFGKEELSNSLYLHRLAVLPQYMNQNLGTEVLTWIYTHFNSRKEYLKLDCVAQNTKLNHFYRSNGFTYIGETDGHSKYEMRLKN